MNFADLAQQSCLVPFTHFPDTVKGVSLVAHLGDHAVPVRGLLQGPGLSDVVGQRLLSEDMLTPLHGVNCRHIMGMVGRADAGGIDLGAHLVQHDPEILEPGDPGNFRDLFQMCPEHRLVDVAESDDVLIALGSQGLVGDAAGTNEGGH